MNTTLQAVGFKTMAYHNYVPSFGEWGYIMASQQEDREWFARFPQGLKFLNPSTLQQMLTFPEDMKAHEALLPNKLNNQVLVGYFEQEWDKYLEQ